MANNIKKFDFKNFLLNNSNESIIVLQDNPRYSDLLDGIADMFSKLYERTQEIQISNLVEFQSTLDIAGVDPDFLLETISTYVDTNHFKETVGRLIRLWEERGDGITDYETFVKENVIPSFQFFTKNAGDLHKSKGTKQLLEKLFNFYDDINSTQKAFNEIRELDEEDSNSFRLKRFTSRRILIDEEVLKSNVTVGGFEDTQIDKYLEGGNMKFVIADGYLFFSELDRDNYFLIGEVDDVFVLNSDWFGTILNGTLSVFAFQDTIYDANGDLIPFVSNMSISDVVFTPRVVNLTDVNGQYHQNSFYFVQLVTGTPNKYVLKRLRYEPSSDNLSFETILDPMGVSFMDDLFVDAPTVPRVTLDNINEIYLDFHDDTADPLFSLSSEVVRVLYTFTFTKVEVINFLEVTNVFYAVTRDGFYYDSEENGFFFNFLDVENDGQDKKITKHIFSQRNMTPQLESDMEGITEDEVRAVFDVYTPQKRTIDIEGNFTNVGSWDASTPECSPPSAAPNHFDYWTVGVAGNTDLDGNRDWKVGDIVVWDGNSESWLKNNNIASIQNDTRLEFFLEHTLLVLGLNEFDTPVGSPDNCITSVYEQKGGMEQYKLSNINLNILNFDSILSVDSNAKDKFGSDPLNIVVYKDQDTSGIFLYSAKTNGFYLESDTVSLSLMLKRYPNKSSRTDPYKVEINENDLVVYTRDKQFSEFKTFAISIENAAYNIPLGLRTNEMNLAYSANFNLQTRERQPYFRDSYVDDNNNVIPVVGEEVDSFKGLMGRYKPINVETDSLYVDFNLSYEDQFIDPLNPIVPDNWDIDGTLVPIREIANMAQRDYLSFNVLGDPFVVGCDCNDVSDALFFSNFDKLKYGYDLDLDMQLITITGDPNSVQLDKVGLVSDEFSGSSDSLDLDVVACRWESAYVTYEAEDGDSIPTQVRHKFYLNLFERYQLLEVAEEEINIPGDDLGVLMLQMEGTNGSTTFIDDSSSAHVITANGTAQIDTSNFKFDAASGLFDGSTAYLSAPNSSVFEFAANYTVEFWVDVNSLPGTFTTLVGVVSGSGEGWGDLTWVIFLRWTGQVSAQVSDNGSPGITLNGTTNISGLGWTHIALVRNGNDTDLYVNGVSDASTSTTYTVQNNTHELRVGHGYSTSRYFDGNIDGVRILDGTAEWTTGFTPPTEPYTSTISIPGSDEDPVKYNWNLVSVLETNDGGGWVQESIDTVYAFSQLGSECVSGNNFYLPFEPDVSDTLQVTTFKLSGDVGPVLLP